MNNKDIEMLSERYINLGEQTSDDSGGITGPMDPAIEKEAEQIVRELKASSDVLDSRMQDVYPMSEEELVKLAIATALEQGLIRNNTEPKRPLGSSQSDSGRFSSKHPYWATQKSSDRPSGPGTSRMHAGD